MVQIKLKIVRYFVKFWKATYFGVGNRVNVEKTAHVSNSRQPVLCIRRFNNDLIAHEEFIDLHLLSGTNAYTITTFIQEI